MLLSLFIVGVPVRMMLQSQLPVSSLDLLVVGLTI
jgi:hypothetical protein